MDKWWRWRASTARRLNGLSLRRYEYWVGCKNIAGKWKELAFNALNYFFRKTLFWRVKVQLQLQQRIDLNRTNPSTQWCSNHDVDYGKMLSCNAKMDALQIAICRRSHTAAHWVILKSEIECKRPSWCHCHSLSLASVKSRLVLPFWYRLTRVVLEKKAVNRVCVCVYIHIYI